MFKIGFKKLFIFYMLITGISSIIGSFEDLPRKKQLATLVKLYTDLAQQKTKTPTDSYRMLVLLGLIEQTLRSQRPT